MDPFIETVALSKLKHKVVLGTFEQDIFMTDTNSCPTIARSTTSNSSTNPIKYPNGADIGKLLPSAIPECPAKERPDKTSNNEKAGPANKVPLTYMLAEMEVSLTGSTTADT
jgi:hypothetical protein